MGFIGGLEGERRLGVGCGGRKEGNEGWEEGRKERNIGMGGREGQRDEEKGT